MRMSEQRHEIGREEFDNLCRAKRFTDGPYVSSFGDDDMHPYLPVRNRQVYGTLDDGRTVWAKGERG